MFRLWTMGVVFGCMACSGGSGIGADKGADADTDADADADTDVDTDADNDIDYPTIPSCTPSCNSSADCDLGSSPYDSDNYACVSGACEWTGCNSDSECDAMMSGWVCTQANSGLDYCAMGCSSSRDCDMGSAPYDSDNYECVSGACEWRGCNSNAECFSVFGSDYVCADSGMGIKACVMACVTTVDCDLGYAAYDSDNYECIGGGCAYIGCNTDQECDDYAEGYVCH